MRVLVTGHDGYIGTNLVPLFQEAGHDVFGMDSGLFSNCVFGDKEAPVAHVVKDVRDVTVDDLRGFDAVVHLAGISNDPLGDLNAETTYDINHRGTIAVAKAAKAAGVQRFLFSSSCSLYGASGDVSESAPLDESADFRPVTPYGESKLLAERDLQELADDDFSPVYLRNATVYGLSPRLRGDLVVNNLTGYAYTIGEVLLKSDGTAWRPLVHVEDVSRAFLALAEAPREVVHNRAYNVGRSSENYRIRDVANIVHDVVTGSVVAFGDAVATDRRDYRVACDRIAEEIPAYQPTWTVRAGVEELYEAYQKFGLTREALDGPALLRLPRILEQAAAGELDDRLFRTSLAAAGNG
jgi:nucleoside-diphosphate-sugar epimerase